MAGKDSLRASFGFLVVISLCLSPLVVCAQERRAARGDTATDVVIELQFSPDGRTLAIARSSRDEQRVELWDVPEGTLRLAIKGFDGPIWSVSFSPDGRTLVTASGGVHPQKVAEKPTKRSGKSFTELKWWDVKTGDFKQRREFAGEDLVSLGAAYSPDGHILATVENRRPMFSNDLLGSAANRGPDRPNGNLRWPRPAFSESHVQLVDSLTGDVTLKLKNKFSGLEVPLPASREDGRSALPWMRGVKPPIFSPDGKLIAAWNGSEVKVWGLNGDEILKLKDFKGNVSAVAFSPDSGLLAAVIVRTYFKDRYPIDFKSEILIWETATGAAPQVIPLSMSTASSLIFASNGQQFLVGGMVVDGEHRHASMELVNLKSGSLGKLIGKDDSNGSAIRVSPNGELMAFQTDASTVKLLSTRDWRILCNLGAESEAASDSALVRRFLVSVKSVEAVAFLADGKSIAGEIEGGGIKVWDARTGETKKTVGREAETGAIAAIAAAGNRVAEIAADESVRVWSVESGEPRTALPAKSKPSAIALSGDGEILAVSAGKTIYLSGPRNSNGQRTVADAADIVSLDLSLDGKSLAAATSEGVVTVWDAAQEKIKLRVNAHAAVTGLRFGSGDRLLAVGCNDGTVSVWNTESGQIVFAGRKHSSAVNAISFSKDGTLMATGSDDRKAIIWEVSGGKVRHTLSGHDLAVTAIAFSPDASTLAVGTGNASIVLWQVEKGKLERVLK